MTAPTSPSDETSQAPGRSTSDRFWSAGLRKLRRDPVTMLAAALLALMVLAALAAPLLAPHDPLATSVLRRLRPVGTSGHLLGTDELGRDILSRLLFGGRLSLFMAVAPVLVAFVVGTLLGLIAGYAGGRSNTVIMRTMDVVFAFPSVLLAVAVAGALGPGVGNAILALTIVFVPPIARVAESVTTQIRSLEYVEAARASGAGAFTIIRVHVLGNVLGPILVYAAGLVSVSIILASGLSFLGLGVKPPVPEWGVMLNTLRNAVFVQPAVAAIPGAMIFVASLLFNLVSDGLRAAMDARAPT